MSAPPTPPPPPPPSSRKVSAAVYSSPDSWKAHVKATQLSALAPSEREKLIDDANRAQKWTVDMAKARKCASRSYNLSKSSTVAYQEQAVMKRSAPAPAAGFGGAPPPPPASYMERSEGAMRSMANDDQAIDCLDESEVAQALMAPPPPPLAAFGQLGSGPHRPLISGESRALALVSHHPVSTVATEAVDAKERDDALSDLKVEPTNDEQRAAKFKIFETFSGQLDAVRSALLSLVAGSVATFPTSVAAGVQQQVKQLDDTANMSIADAGRYWFVYDMSKMVFNNCDKMRHVSTSVEQKAAFLANSTQTQCPICMETFEAPGAAGGRRSDDDDGSGGGDDGDDGPRCVPRVLQCCHRVCEPCWTQWVAIKGGPANAFCPICKNKEFLEEVARM